MKRLTLIVLLLGAAFYSNAQAWQSEFFFSPPLLAAYSQTAPDIITQAAVLIDAHTGALLHAKNPDMEIPPASLTKLMAMHLIMNEIRAGRASYDEIIPITAESWAANQPPRSSLMFLEPGQIVTLHELLTGLAVPSGNDASVATALRFAPTMDDFAHLMTEEARRMGLTRTRFVEASGISPFNMTTAAEFAHFSRVYITLHPHAMENFHSRQSFSFPKTWNVPNSLGDAETGYIQYINRRIPHTITQHNRNTLLRTFYGVDGLKTGFIEESGFNVSLTAQRDETRFILVLLGAPSGPGGDRIRAEDGRRLLEWAFDNFKTVRPVIRQIDDARLWMGRTNTASLTLAYNADFTSPSGRAAGSKLIYETYFPFHLIAPLPAGTFAGHLVISDEYGELHRVPIVTAAAYERGNIFRRIWHSILLLFQR